MDKILESDCTRSIVARCGSSAERLSAARKHERSSVSFPYAEEISISS